MSGQIKLVLVCLFGLCFTPNLWAQTEADVNEEDSTQSTTTKSYYEVADVPDPKVINNTYVSDPDNQLSSTQKDELNELLANIYNTGKAEVAVVILNSIGGKVPKEFATDLFNYWEIGNKQGDNGLLILVILNQRRAELETGYGLEAILPDVACTRLSEKYLVPYFRRKDYGGGLVALIKALTPIIEKGEVYQSPISIDTQDDFYLFYLLIYLVISIVIGVIALIIVVLTVKAAEAKDPYQAYLSTRSVTSGVLAFIFPFPYAFIYFYAKSKMKGFRNAPRDSKVNGKPMNKLGEKEDDAFLEAGQVKEESLGSVDYDVWITEDEADRDVVILKYDQRWSGFSACSSCGYKTYSKDYDRTIVAPTYSSTGEGETKHSCKHCGYQNVRRYTIPMLTKDNGSSSSGGSSSGGGSWGGGSSGGGGGGASW